jgi:hypothetical protein
MASTDFVETLVAAMERAKKSNQIDDDAKTHKAKIRLAKAIDDLFLDASATGLSSADILRTAAVALGLGIRANAKDANRLLAAMLVSEIILSIAIEEPN